MAIELYNNLYIETILKKLMILLDILREILFLQKLEQLFYLK